jgi:hypothetical protein
MGQSRALPITSLIEAEERRKELIEQLAKVSDGLAKSEEEMRSVKEFEKKSAVTANSLKRRPGASTIVKPGSNLWGSSFEWKGTQHRGHYHSNFQEAHADWDKRINDTFATKTRYGELTKIYDLPHGAELHINKEPIEVKRRQTVQISRAPGTTPSHFVPKKT